jgi:hypothetical protein
MFNTENPLLWLAGLLLAAGLVWLLRGHFGAAARERRRRERSHGRVVSKGRGPMIKLAVETERPKKKP